MLIVVFIGLLLMLGWLLDEEFELSQGDVLVRLSVALVLGSFCAAWLTFLFALLLGLSSTALGCATASLLAACAFLLSRNRLQSSARALSGRMVDLQFWGVYGWIVAAVVGCFFFGVWRSSSGDIEFRGNFTDLSYHMAIVSAFLEQTDFPPLNPQSASAQLRYHFMADFLVAVLCKGGMPLFTGMKVFYVSFSFALGTLTCFLFHRVANHRWQGVFGVLLLLAGHNGALNLLFGLAGYPVGNGPLSSSWAAVEDHLTYPYFNFLNVLVNFFQPQLPFLAAWPLAMLLVLVFHQRNRLQTGVTRTTFLLVAVTALMPLFHMHTFLLIAPLMGIATLVEVRRSLGAQRSVPGSFEPARSGLHRVGWLFTMGGVAALLILVQFRFLGAEAKPAGFSGFDVQSRLGPLAEIPTWAGVQRFWFWIRVAGLPLLLGMAGFLVILLRLTRKRCLLAPEEAGPVVYFLVGAGYFLVINFYRFTPSWGDSNKFYLYWSVGLAFFAARLVLPNREVGIGRRALAGAMLLVGGALPMGVELAGRYARPAIPLFSAMDQFTGDWIRKNTPRDAVFLTANSYTHYVTAIGGRRVVNGSYTRETGFSSDELERAVALAYRHGNTMAIPGPKAGYMVVGPDERAVYRVSDQRIERQHQLVFRSGAGFRMYSIYSVNSSVPDHVVESGGDFVWLSDLEPLRESQFGVLRYDENFDQGGLSIAGRTYSRGLGTHAPSEIEFEVPPGSARLEAEIGVDGSQSGSPASVRFKVQIDGALVFTSELMTAASRAIPVTLNVENARRIVLLVEDGGDGITCDHANWAEARFTKKESREKGRSE